MFFAVLGAIVGSFLNVVALRLHGRTFLRGRSLCASCGETISPRDLIPVVSYLLLWGRCRHCRSRIPRRYFLVELVGGFIFALLALTAPSPLPFILLALSFSLLLLIALYDLQHLIIPDEFVYPFIALSLLLAVVRVEAAGWGTLLAGPLLALPFLLLALLSRGRLMGWGDVKLGLGVGFLLGIPGSVAAFLFSMWIGGGVGAGVLAFQRMGFVREGPALTMKSEIPFAPFLVLAAFLAQVSGLTLPQLLHFFEI